MQQIEVRKEGNIFYVSDNAWLAFVEYRKQQKPTPASDVKERMAKLKAEREAEIARQRAELEGYLGA